MRAKLRRFPTVWQLSLELIGSSCLQEPPASAWVSRLYRTSDPDDLASGVADGLGVEDVKFKLTSRRVKKMKRDERHTYVSFDLLPRGPAQQQITGLTRVYDESRAERLVANRLVASWTAPVGDPFFVEGADGLVSRTMMLDSELRFPTIPALMMILRTGRPDRNPDRAGGRAAESDGRQGEGEWQESEGE